jgi:hypothetical protein
MAKYGKNRGRVKRVGVLLGYISKIKFFKPLLIRLAENCSIVYPTKTRKLIGLAGFLLSNETD